MGRWAQRTRGGGGINALNQITFVVQSAIAKEEISYEHAVDASQLVAAEFTSNPSGETGVSMIQSSPTVIEVTFTSDVGGDTELVYTGSTPGIQTPQTVPIS
jgi:hypothetical protein